MSPNSDEVERRKSYPEILAKLNFVCEEVKEMNKVLKGNGQPGLVDTVGFHEQFIKRQMKFHENITRTIWKCTGTIVAMVIGSLITYHLLPK